MQPFLRVKNLSMHYDTRVIMQNISFDLQKGEIFVIIGESGCGKSTLLRYLIGLIPATAGHIFYQGIDFALANSLQFEQISKQFGVLFQNGALWSSMTIAENVALPLKRHTKLPQTAIADLVTLKLSLVGLEDYATFYPSELSGGMCKRAGLARAMALDPNILFFDEPTAGLDPISARRFDDLILDLKQSFETTIVIVTHDLETILGIGEHIIFLDNETKTVLEEGSQKSLLNSKIEKIRKFLSFRLHDFSLKE